MDFHVFEDENNDDNYTENDSEDQYDYEENYSAEYSGYEGDYNYEEYYPHYQQEQSENVSNSNNFCDTCERGFATASQLSFHLKEHRVCGIDGCKFVAHSKIVEKHISSQHETGLYYKIPQSNSPEDIAKWKAERKKRYPTKENIEKRQKEQKEMMKRGERLFKSKDKFGRKTKKVADTSKKDNQKKSRFKDRKNKLSHLKKDPPKIKKINPPVSLLDDKSNWNGNLRPFPGTSELYESENEIVKTDEKFDDSEWLTEQQEAPKIELKNALGALIGAYRSSDESDCEINVPEVKIVKKTEEISKEDNVEGPEEKKITKETNIYLSEKIEKDDKNKPNRKRRRKHSRTENNKMLKKNNSEPQVKNRKITLLERLLESEIKQERNIILQCVRYVVQNNFFDQNISSEVHDNKVTENTNSNIENPSTSTVLENELNNSENSSDIEPNSDTILKNNLDNISESPKPELQSEIPVVENEIIDK